MNKKMVAVLSKIVKGIIVCGLLFLMCKGAVGAYEFGYGIFMDEAVVEDAQGRSVEVSLLENSDAKAIGKQLESMGIIKDDMIFYVQALFAGCNDDLKGGKYTLSNSMRPSEIMAVLQEGPQAAEADGK